MTMTEAAYSANFHIWHPERIRVQVTVRSDDPSESLPNMVSDEIDALIAAGYTADEPLPVEGEKQIDICGWVLGEYQDKNAGGFRPCVYLYNANLEFKVATVYPEKFEMLPFDFDPQAKRVEGVAPTLALARQKGHIHDAAFRIVLVPQLDYGTGEPRRSDKGNIIYKFDRVVGATPLPANLDDVPAMSPEPHTNGNGSLAPVFTGPENAIAWGVEQGAFSNATAAHAAYDELKAEIKPTSAQEMFSAWIGRVTNLKRQDALVAHGRT